MFEVHAMKILLFSIIFLILINILNRNFRRLSKLLWFGKVILTLLVLITGEIVLVNRLAETTHISNVKMGFDILWWLVPAYLINLEHVGWTELAKSNIQKDIIPKMLD